MAKTPNPKLLWSIPVLVKVPCFVTVSCISQHTKPLSAVTVPLEYKAYVPSASPFEGSNDCARRLFMRQIPHGDCENAG
jgi:hypothetical protein